MEQLLINYRLLLLFSSKLYVKYNLSFYPYHTGFAAYLFATTSK